MNFRRPLEHFLRLPLEVEVAVPATSGVLDPHKLLLWNGDGIKDGLDVLWPCLKVIADLVDECWDRDASGGGDGRVLVEVEACAPEDHVVQVLDVAGRDSTVGQIHAGGHVG
ncbi:unnamed protein product [Clonostachys rhizophaga]|uniref:Uncharacterized protein n=1 Tax=Clonostachys rhizophaga TaxID=160324 RepID=A0A9N9VPN6_9HYPO|nr:unnamed protein product [Clonostachys rhizophaga]